MSRYIITTINIQNKEKEKEKEKENYNSINNRKTYLKLKSYTVNSFRSECIENNSNNPRNNQNNIQEVIQKETRHDQNDNRIKQLINKYKENHEKVGSHQSNLKSIDFVKSNNVVNIDKSYKIKNNEDSFDSLNGESFKGRRKSISLIKSLMKFKRIRNNINSKTNRVPYKFKNIEDSLSEDNDLNYFDYVNKWYSIIPNSKLSIFNKAVKEFLISILLIYLPFELIFKDSLSNFFTFFRIFIEILLIFNHLCLFVTGFYDVHGKNINYNVYSIISNIYKSSNVLYIVYEQISIFFMNSPVILLLFEGLSLSNFNSLYQISIIFKFGLFMNLNTWIQINPILETINRLMISSDNKKSAKTQKKKKEEKQNDVLISLYKLLAVFRVIIYYVLLIHISTCLWIFCYEIERDKYFNSNNWVENLNFTEVSFFNLYISGFYFTLTTLLSVGYGDIRPYNQTERIFTIIFMSIGVLFYSFLVTLISSLVVNSVTKKARFLEKKTILEEISKEHKISEELYSRINNSLIHAAQSFKADKLLLIEDLPSNIKDSVLFCMYKNLIKTLNFLKNEEKNFIVSSIQLLQTNIYDRNYKIMNIGQRINEMYFIMKGKINIQMSETYNNFCLSSISNGEHFVNNLFEKNIVISPYNLVTKSSLNEIVSLSKDCYFDLKYKFPNVLKTKLKEIEFKVKFIEELENGVIHYFHKNSSLKGFKEYSIEKINNEINKELNNKDTDGNVYKDNENRNYKFQVMNLFNEYSNKPENSLIKTRKIKTLKEIIFNKSVLKIKPFIKLRRKFEENNYFHYNNSSLIIKHNYISKRINIKHNRKTYYEDENSLYYYFKNIYDNERNNMNILDDGNSIYESSFNNKKYMKYKEKLKKISDYEKVFGALNDIKRLISNVNIYKNDEKDKIVNKNNKGRVSKRQSNLINLNTYSNPNFEFGEKAIKVKNKFISLENFKLILHKKREYFDEK